MSAQARNTSLESCIFFAKRLKGLHLFFQVSTHCLPCFETWYYALLSKSRTTLSRQSQPFPSGLSCLIQPSMIVISHLKKCLNSLKFSHRRPSWHLYSKEPRPPSLDLVQSLVNIFCHTYFREFLINNLENSTQTSWAWKVWTTVNSIFIFPLEKYQPPKLNDW